MKAFIRSLLVKLIGFFPEEQVINVYEGMVRKDKKLKFIAMHDVTGKEVVVQTFMPLILHGDLKHSSRIQYGCIEALNDYGEKMMVSLADHTLELR